MWFTLGILALKTGAEIYKNKKKAKLLESEAEVKHLERAVAGEVELQKIVHKRQESDFKDEFCLILLSLPLLILAYSVFFGDAELQERVDYLNLQNRILRNKIRKYENNNTRTTGNRKDNNTAQSS